MCSSDLKVHRLIENYAEEIPPAQAEPRLPESEHSELLRSKSGQRGLPHNQNEHGSFSGSPNDNGRLSPNESLPQETAPAARYTERLPENISGSPNGQHGLSPNPNESGSPAPDSVEPSRLYPSEPQPAAPEAIPAAFESSPPWDDAPPAGLETALSGGALSQRLPENEQGELPHSQNGQNEPFPAQSAAAEAPENTDTAALPLPDADTWPQIVAAIAPKIGAAQMSAQHTACLGYDPQQHLLTLAVAEAGQISIIIHLLLMHFLHLVDHLIHEQ